ncbi:hypothetical protein FRC02_006470 [Tulasnella sp. 418]|nr:hypothetical protein FRC02_006470 [Tulasnella sp. 418]
MLYHEEDLKSRARKLFPGAALLLAPPSLSSPASDYPVSSSPSPSRPQLSSSGGPTKVLHGRCDTWNRTMLGAKITFSSRLME